MFSLALLTILAASANLLNNHTFDGGLDGWTVNNPNGSSKAATVDGRTSVEMSIPDSAAVSWPCFLQEFPVKPEQLVESHVEAMARNVRDGYGVYASLEFLDEKGQRINFEQSPAAIGDGAWSTLKIHAFAPPASAKVRLSLLLNGHGEAYFDNASLTIDDDTRATDPSGPVTIEVTGHTACESLIGFGAEADGWFYNEDNAAHGVTKEDWPIREKRIEWMNPDWVRVFFWYKDWNPSGDWETFDFDTPNMQSHYRTLDQYQRLGTRINVTGVEWGVKDPYKEPARTARAIGALFEHLIKVKSYTCVQDWTLSNEPNGYFVGAGYDFARFTELHSLVKEEFARRNLSVRILGSDDTNGLPWFEQCVKDDRYFAAADLFASHRYIGFTSRKLLPSFLEDRMEWIERRTPVKPFIVAEFGFQDKRSGTMENPLMEEYPYAVWTTTFAIDCLNRGVAGMSIWCLHEMYYPGGGLMNYGLWDYKDNNWKPRPVYHAWAMFTRLTEAGDRSIRCESSHPGYVRGAFVNGILFWVNQSEKAIDVEIKGAKAKEARVMTETTLAGDRECGETRKIEGERFQAPPMSFGYAR